MQKNKTAALVKHVAAKVKKQLGVNENVAMGKFVIKQHPRSFAKHPQGK